MRTTLSISNDVLLIARQIAARAQTQQPATKAKLKSKYSVLPERNEIITNEHVRRLMDEEGI
jgi:hypothetical protein